MQTVSAVPADSGKHTAIDSVVSNAKEMRICFSDSKSFRCLSIGRDARADMSLESIAMLLAGVAESKARYFKRVGRYAFGLLVGLKILDA